MFLWSPTWQSCLFHNYVNYLQTTVIDKFRKPCIVTKEVLLSLLFRNFFKSHLTPRLLDQPLVQVDEDVDGDVLQCAGMDDDSQGHRDLMQRQLGSAEVDCFQPNQALTKQNGVQICQVVVGQWYVLEMGGVLRDGSQQQFQLVGGQLAKAETSQGEVGERTW